METTTLRNGTTEATPLVAVVMRILRSLMEKNPIAFYELVTACRDREHELFGNTEQILRDWSLWPLPDSLRNIVLSAVTGNGLDMTLGSPSA